MQQAEDAVEAHERFKEQTRVALSDYSEMLYREQTMRADIAALRRDIQEKDGIIKEFRKQSTIVTHRKQELEDELISMRQNYEVKEQEVEELPRLRERLAFFDSEEAVQGIAFARRLASEVFGMTIDDFTLMQVSVGKMKTKGKSNQTKWALDAVISRLRGFNMETEGLKKQVKKLRLELHDVRQLVPVWNEHVMQDLMDAYDEDSVVHHQVFSMQDRRNFAGLGLHHSVPSYLRAEGFVRHIYVSKAEIEDFMDSFHAEASADLTSEQMHAELHTHIQKNFPESAKAMEFAYAFICSLEAYRDDPDFELFDLMLSGAVHPSIRQDQEELLKELQTLVRNCHEGQIDPEKSAPVGNGRVTATARQMSSQGKAPGVREQVTRRVMRAVLQAMFPEKAVARHNSLIRALHVTLQMLFDSGKSPHPDVAFISDLFAATADGTQSPLIEELRRQQVHEVLEHTADIARRFRKRAGGEHYVDRGTRDNYLLIGPEAVRQTLKDLYPSMAEKNMQDMLELTFPPESVEEMHVSEVLQNLRHNRLLKKDRCWVRASTKAVVDELLKLGPPASLDKEDRRQSTGGGAQAKKRSSHIKGRSSVVAHESKDVQEDEAAVQPRRIRALKVVDNPNARGEQYNTPQGIEKEILRSGSRNHNVDDEEQLEDQLIEPAHEEKAEETG